MELNNKPTILHLTTSMDTGGMERQLLLTIPRLHDFNHVIICLKKWGTIGDQLKTLGFPVYFVPTPHLFSLRATTQCKKIVQHHKPNLIITYLPFADIFGRILGRYSGIARVICFLHSTMREWRYFPLVILNIVTQRWVNHFFAVSNSVRERYERLGLSRGATDVIHNGVVIPVDEKSSDMHYILTLLPKLPNDTHLLGYVGQLRKERGHELLFRIIKILQTRKVGAHLALIGDGPYRVILEAHLAQLGIRDMVTFLGYRSDVPKLLSEFSVYVHPSIYEGMSVALLEAMAAGCPIITTDIPENRELIQNDTHGILVPPKNPEALADAIEFALKNPEKMRQLGDNARQRAQETFNIDHTVAQLTQLLQKYAK